MPRISAVCRRFALMLFLVTVTVFGQTLIFNSEMDVRSLQDPRPSPAPVEQLRAGRVTVTVPPFRYYTMLVFRMAK